MSYCIKPDYKLLREFRYYNGAVRDIPHQVLNMFKGLKKMTADSYQDLKQKILAMNVPKTMIPVVQGLSVERNLVFANKLVGRSLVGIIEEKEQDGKNN